MCACGMRRNLVEVEPLWNCSTIVKFRRLCVNISYLSLLTYLWLEHLWVKINCTKSVGSLTQSIKAADVMLSTRRSYMVADAFIHTCASKHLMRYWCRFYHISVVVAALTTNLELRMLYELHRSLKTSPWSSNKGLHLTIFSAFISIALIWIIGCGAFYVLVEHFILLDDMLLLYAKRILDLYTLLCRSHV